jgi:hypothetical protein
MSVAKSLIFKSTGSEEQSLGVTDYVLLSWCKLCLGVSGQSWFLMIH